MSVETLNFLLALGTVGLQVGALALLALLTLRAGYPAFERAAELVRAGGLWLAFALAFFGSVLTLVYSGIFGFPPCPLCWWQRVFLYSQAVLFAIAAWRKDVGITLYALVLSTLGLSVALYHHALQVLPSGSLPCPAEGAVSCAQRFLFEFGYITYPLMAASLFAFLIALLLVLRAPRTPQGTA